MLTSAGFVLWIFIGGVTYDAGHEMLTLPVVFRSEAYCEAVAEQVRDKIAKQGGKFTPYVSTLCVKAGDKVS